MGREGRTAGLQADKPAGAARSSQQRWKEAQVVWWGPAWNLELSGNLPPTKRGWESCDHCPGLQQISKRCLGQPGAEAATRAAGSPADHQRTLCRSALQHKLYPPWAPTTPSSVISPQGDRQTLPGFSISAAHPGNSPGSKLRKS